MTKHEAQLRFAATAVQVIASEMADGDFSETGTETALYGYLELVKYVSAHGMRASGTLVELREIHTFLADTVTQEVMDAVEHYIDEVTALYPEAA